MENEEMLKEFSESIAKIKEEVHKDIVGQDDVIDNVITAIIAGGNVLLEGVPGTGKQDQFVHWDKHCPCHSPEFSLLLI